MHSPSPETKMPVLDATHTIGAALALLALLHQPSEYYVYPFGLPWWVFTCLQVYFISRALLAARHYYIGGQDGLG